MKGFIKAYIDQKLHLYIELEDFAAMDAYFDDKEKGKYKHTIRIHLKNGQSFETGYDTKEKWLNVIDQIEACVLLGSRAKMELESLILGK